MFVPSYSKYMFQICCCSDIFACLKFFYCNGGWGTREPLYLMDGYIHDLEPLNIHDTLCLKNKVRIIQTDGWSIIETSGFPWWILRISFKGRQGFATKPIFQNQQYCSITKVVTHDYIFYEKRASFFIIYSNLDIILTNLYKKRTRADKRWNIKSKT